MGRKAEPLYLDSATNTYYARLYEGEPPRRVLLSLCTSDKAVAMQRYPVCFHAHMGWRDYLKSTVAWNPAPTATIKSVATATENGIVALTPPQKIITDKTALEKLLQEAILAGRAGYNSQTGEWTIQIPPKTDSVATELSSLVSSITSPTRPTAPVTDEFEAIKEFYTVAVPQMFVDKEAATRFSRIWLGFLQLRKVISWSQISDALLLDFKEWRGSTPIVVPGHPVRNPKPPAEPTVNRTMTYLKSSFELAVDRGLLNHNPLRFAKFPKSMPPEQEYLTVDELKRVLADPALQKAELHKGPLAFPLPYRYLDIVLLLFCACKRRKEILTLRIEDISFEKHYAYYTEYKNARKPGKHGKAFWLTPGMEALLKRVIGDRKQGLVFPGPWDADESLSPDLLTVLFGEVCARVVPEKTKVTLKNLRQTCHAAGETSGQLSPQDLDMLLGHYKVAPSTGFYQDHSKEATAIRQANMTRKGVEVMAGVVAEFL